MKIKLLTISFPIAILLLAALLTPFAFQGGFVFEKGRSQAYAAGNAIVDIAHFAPFADANTAGSTSVTVKVDGVDALTDFEFGDIAEDIELAEGHYLIEIYPTGEMTPAISRNVNLKGGKSYTLAAIGDGVNQPLELFVVERDTVPDPSNAKLFVGHVAPFNNTDAAVDVCTDAGSDVLADFKYEDYTDPYLTLPPGDYDLQIRVADVTPCAGALALDIPSIRLAAGDIVDVYAIGLANNWPLSVASTTGFTLGEYKFYLPIIYR